MNKYICVRELIFRLFRDVSLGRLCSNSLIASTTTPQHFGVVRLHVNAFYFSTTAKRVTSPTWGPPPPCKQALIFIHKWSRLFFSVKGYCVSYDKRNNTWLLVDMEFLFSCSTRISLVRCAHSWAIELNNQREIPYLRAPMYYSLFIELDDSDSKRCVKVDGYEILIYNTDVSYLPLTEMGSTKEVFSFKISIWG